MKLRFISFIFLGVLLLGGCNSTSRDDGQMLDSHVVTNPNSASGDQNQDRLPLITFEVSEHDFGRIIEGETVSFSFPFTNSGKVDLLIADVSTSCGCTVPSYPKDAIVSGGTGVIKVAFNSKGRRGFQTKTIIVVANTQPNVTQLKIKAQVVAPGTE